MTQARSGSDALDELFWQAEILQALYWMHGESIATEVTPPALASFLAAEPTVVAEQMGRLAMNGYLEPTGISEGASSDGAGSYRLTPLGRAEGGRSFQDEFADLTRPSHGECAADCACHDPSRGGEPCPVHPGGPSGD